MLIRKHRDADSLCVTVCCTSGDSKLFANRATLRRGTVIRRVAVRLPGLPSWRLLSSGTTRVLGIEAFDSSLPPLFAGAKRLTVRTFPLPKECADQPLVLLSRADPPHSEQLPDALAAGAGGFRLAGVVQYSHGAESYADRAAFEADEAEHHMPRGSALYAKYAGEIDGPWPGPLGQIYAWHYASAAPAPDWLQDAATPAVRRWHGPLFEVDVPSDALARWPKWPSEKD